MSSGLIRLTAELPIWLLELLENKYDLHMTHLSCLILWISKFLYRKLATFSQRWRISLMCALATAPMLLHCHFVALITQLYLICPQLRDISDATFIRIFWANHIQSMVEGEIDGPEEGRQHGDYHIIDYSNLYMLRQLFNWWGVHWQLHRWQCGHFL